MSVSFKTTPVTSAATSFISCPSTSLIDFSPAIDGTGIVSFVRESSAKSFAAY